MDTEKYVLVNEETMKDFENVNYIDGSAEEMSDIIDYIELVLCQDLARNKMRSSVS